jgi:nitrile hydratase accessory protein
MRPEALTAPFMPRAADGPVFAAPWESRAFALAVKLSQQGFFTWSEWVETFSAEIGRKDADWDGNSADYYTAWLATLEKLLVSRGVVAEGDLASAFDEALATWPHPDHEARREPVARALPFSD